METDEVSMQETIKTALEIRWPLLARGTKAVGFDLIAFLTINNHCYSAIRLVMLLCL